ncbi:MAG: efflux RND transporter periplasmic adaptor subunit [Nitrospiraceae bacterium]|nr:efflux RND transporter periplasmic adaptor subunit [Nitrospiraceae bacterium]
MKRPIRNILVGIIIACILVGIFLFYHKRQTQEAKSTGSPEGTDSPVASVKVIPLKRNAIALTVSVYGEVVPAPGATQVVSIPYESRVRHIMVSSGQKISLKEVLIEVEPSPNTYLQLERAQNDYETSEQNLSHVQQMFDLKLATNTQLLQAKQAFQQAQLRLKSLRQRGIGVKKLIRTDVTGLVSKVYIQEGAIVPAGNPLMDIVAQNRLEVRLGVEPADIGRLHPGEPVLITYVDVPVSEGTTGKIRKISRAVNPTSRLVDVFVNLPESSRFLLGEYILGRITVASSKGLVVPRDAVLTEDGNHFLFTVRGGHAVKHIVQVGLESGGEIEISGTGLKPGKQVVVVGNYELKDGMPVRIAESR